MSTRLYLLPGGDGDETKVWYPLGLGMRMRMNCFYGVGYEIAKPVPAPPAPLPSLLVAWQLLVQHLQGRF